MSEESLNKPQGSSREEILGWVKANYAQRTPLAVIEQVFVRLFQGNSIRSIDADHNIDASRRVAEQLDKFLKEEKITSWEDLKIPAPEKSITHQVREQHMKKMSHVLEKDWSLRYFRELGINTKGKALEEALIALRWYEEDKDSEELTIDMLQAVFWVYLHTLELKPNSRPFKSLVRLFAKELIIHANEFPGDEISVWGLIKFEVWNGKENAEAYQKAYEFKRKGNIKIGLVRHKKMYQESLEDQKEIFGGKDE